MELTFAELSRSVSRRLRGFSANIRGWKGSRRVPCHIFGWEGTRPLHVRRWKLPGFDGWRSRRLRFVRCRTEFVRVSSAARGLLRLLLNLITSRRCGCGSDWPNARGTNAFHRVHCRRRRPDVGGTVTLRFPILRVYRTILFSVVVIVIIQSLLTRLSHSHPFLVLPFLLRRHRAIIFSR